MTYMESLIYIFIVDVGSEMCPYRFYYFIYLQIQKIQNNVPS